MRRSWSTAVLLVCIACALTIAGCGTGGSDSGTSWYGGGDGGGTTTTPLITSVSNIDLPGQPIRVGDWIQIQGSGFGTTRLGTTSEGYVAFSDGTADTKAVLYGQWSDTLVECQVPQGAPIKALIFKESVSIYVVKPDTTGGGSSYGTNANPTPNPSPQTTPPSPSPSPSPTGTATPSPTPTPSPSASPTPSPSPTSGGGGGGGAAATYTVTYSGNGSTRGTVPVDSNTYKEGDTVTVSGNTGYLARINVGGVSYIVDKWNTKADGSGTDYGANFTMGAANVTLYAKWAACAIGGSGPAGGWIFYDAGNYDAGWRYLEAAPSDQGAGIQWSYDKNILIATSPDIGKGQENTNAIVAALGAGTCAARICYDLELNTYDDCFLPSHMEFERISVNLILGAGEGFIGNFHSVYWNSSQDDREGHTQSAFAWSLTNDPGNVYVYADYSNKEYTNNVRAARRF
ncbi:MAG: InlB B-repeat-containing protein [Candidatus Xenobiia bacterium LiM19]